ncbi:dimethylamine monooxygenase subunit DmmA family protein [Silvanigrella aquatica]|uniref:Uncharacterized protein n=1 Tax=Silvanigrella aquatica TaxID=1915309 RepID=A0A1L4D3V6_9BACT|nr:dimethylamine monooxygenase subunit DmmA family protein [Silvanigrella aquatica]APJ04857.1 hypothetical protein AXG55_13510 [Silvanigrella aquatica]
MENGYSIKSKPIYSLLLWDDKALFHMIIVQGLGGMSVLKMFQIKFPKNPVIIFYSKKYMNEVDYPKLINNTYCNNILINENDDDLFFAVENMLPEMFMGLRIYVVGSENFIWTVSKIADKYGYDDSNIIKELTNTLARSVYCTHCKLIMNDINTNIIKCFGCNKVLIIREHFSRRLGAYMGVMVNAESAYDFPKVEEIFP